MEEHIEQPEHQAQEAETISSATVHEVKIGEVTVTEPVTATHVLASHGVIEITNPDGSKSQYSKEQAQARVAEQEALVKALQK